MAPTYASDQLEFSLSRARSLPGLPSFFQKNSFSYKLVLRSKDQRVTASSPIFQHSLTAAERHSPGPKKPTPLASKDSTHLRLMTWNVEYGTILKKPDIYSRILHALNPDVILFQELTNNETPQALSALLNQALPLTSEPWQVMVSEGGGSIGCGIASRYPAQRIEPIEEIPYPNRPEWTVRALGAAVTCPNGKQLMVTSIHLKCCGRIGSSEDQTRFQEAAAINTTIKALGNAFDGMVIGGDLNLVGSYNPIQRLGQNLGTNQSDLSIVDPYRLSGKSNATWANPGGRFAPGRLDYLLRTDQPLQEVRSFVLNTADLTEETRSSHSLLPEDSSEASDHFPIIVDLAWSESL